MEKKLLWFARILAVAGIGLITLAVFVDYSKVAGLQTAQAKQESFKWELQEKYTVEKPAAPADFSRLVPQPVKPSDNAADAEKTQYDADLKAYEEQKKIEEDNFKKAQADYEKALTKHDYKVRAMAYKKAKEADDVNKQIKAIDRQVTERKVTVSSAAEFAYVMRFIGSLFLLLGSLGILIYAENMEKLGILIVLGFAFKTIIGL